MSSPFSYRAGSGTSSPFTLRTSVGGSGGGNFLSGAFSFIGHLGTDIKDAAFGIPMGIVNLAKHPVGSIEAMAKSTWHDWSPLFHGQFGKEWSQFLAHPLAPILDLGMVAGAIGAPFTAGASLDLSLEADLARGGIAIGDIGKMGDAISQSARIVKVPAEAKFLPGVNTNKLFLVRYHTPLGKGDMVVPSYVKQLSSNPLIQARQVALAKLGGQLSDNLVSWTGRTPIRQGLVSGKAEASFERELSRREVAFQANTEMVNRIAKGALDQARTALEGKGITTAHLSDYEVATHAQIAQMIRTGEWLGKAPTEQWAGLAKWMHGQLLKHPMYVAATKEEAKALMKQGFIGVKPEFPGIVAADNFEQMLVAASGVGRKGFLEKNVSKMARNEQGHYLLVPHEAAFNWMREGQNSASFLKSLYKNPARIWKMTQVGWSPKTVMNTSVGNSFMLMMGQPRAFLHLVDGIRAAKGADSAARMLRETGNFEPGILAEHFSDVIHSSNAAAKAGVSPISDVGGTSRAAKILKTGFYGGVHKVEQGLKRGSIIASLHASSEVKDLMASGKSFEDAAQAALSKNPMLRDNVARTALLHIGNYEMFSKGEQRIKNFVPFYSWDRHIVAHTASMIATQPIRTAALAAVGNQGSAATDKYLPGVPIYMRTNLPLAALGIASTKTLDTIGLNPYSSIADLAGAAIGLTTGAQSGPNFAPSEDTAGQLSPIITGLIQGITGHSILTDKALPNYGGPISTAAVNVFNNLPQVRLARLATFGAPHGSSPPLYADTFQRLLSKYIGVPIQEPNLARAQATEAKIEKKKHSSQFTYR